MAQVFSLTLGPMEKVKVRIEKPSGTLRGGSRAKISGNQRIKKYFYKLIIYNELIALFLTI